jgi:hypothetical protein
VNILKFFKLFVFIAIAKSIYIVDAFYSGLHGPSKSFV